MTQPNQSQQPLRLRELHHQRLLRSRRYLHLVHPLVHNSPIWFYLLGRILFGRFPDHMYPRHLRNLPSQSSRKHFPLLVTPCFRLTDLLRGVLRVKNENNHNVTSLHSGKDYRKLWISLVILRIPTWSMATAGSS